MKKTLVTLAVVTLTGLGVFCYAASRPARVVSHDTTSTTTPTKVPVKQPSTFDTKQLSTIDPTSLWVVVNKQHALQPASYAPSDLVIPNVPLRVPGNATMKLRAEPAAAVERMFAAAKADGLGLMVSSGYRSYDYQVSLYSGYVSSAGQAQADVQSARPGYSEHQTGLAFDVEPVSRTCELEQCFADTPEGKWMAAHAYNYGFILRYTPVDVSVTGYESEPWHFRYVGGALAGEIHHTGASTLETFFGITGGDKY